MKEPPPPPPPSTPTLNDNYFILLDQYLNGAMTEREFKNSLQYTIGKNDFPNHVTLIRDCYDSLLLLEERVLQEIEEERLKNVIHSSSSSNDVSDSGSGSLCASDKISPTPSEDKRPKTYYLETTQQQPITTLSNSNQQNQKFKRKEVQLETLFFENMLQREKEINSEIPPKLLQHLPSTSSSLCSPILEMLPNCQFIENTLNCWLLSVAQQRTLSTTTTTTTTSNSINSCTTTSTNTNTANTSTNNAITVAQAKKRKHTIPCISFDKIEYLRDSLQRYLQQRVENALICSIDDDPIIIQKSHFSDDLVD